MNGIDIELKCLSKKYNEEVVLENVSYTFAAGSITCIMGSSGIGKTTLLRILLGLENADYGSVIVQTAGDNVPCKCDFSVVFQDDRLVEPVSAVVNVRLVTGHMYTDDEIRQELAKVLLSEAVEKPVNELSGGMRRRVAIVRAMMHKSDVVIMDEPFTGLDEDSKCVVTDYIKTALAGRTLIMVTHDKEDVKALGADVWLLTR